MTILHYKLVLVGRDDCIGFEAINESCASGLIL